MNAGLPDTHPSVHYYDSDYPGAELSPYPENLDDVLEAQGLAFDVERYKGLAAAAAGPVLELCCGTGRVAIPLARAGASVTAVDVSEGMLAQLRAHLAREPADVAARVSVVRADIRTLALPRRDYALAIMAFNSLMCLTDLSDQRRAIEAAAAHLGDGGSLVLDLVNPLTLPLGGEPVPKPFFTRRSVRSGNVYTRFAAFGPLDAAQRQRLFGWYDELAPDGTVRRTPYAMLWRPIFRYELELLLVGAGLAVEAVEGGHRGEPFAPQSRKMFVTARRPP